MSTEIESPRPSPEWPATLDIKGLMSSGWRPTPFRQFILKVHSRCNLACDYCYVYTFADQSWRNKPLVMAPEVAATTAARIAEHARAHRISAVKVVLHGGEPLLAGREYLAELVRVLRAAAAPDVAVDVAVQTNGVLLDERFLRLLLGLDVRVGISLDGGEEANDRHRRTLGNRGTYAAVARALRHLTRPEFRPIYGGLLATIDLDNDPIETYEALLAFHPPRIDFLLPHGTWAAPPPGRTPDPTATPYADWLTALFDRWYGERPPATGIRLFEEIVHLLLGGRTGLESMGIAPSTLVVIETDGTVEQSDFLKIVAPGEPVTGLNVVDHSLDDALRTPGMVARQIGVEALSGQCRSCDFLRVCGGGLYAHRYRPGTGYKNPSVYCPDLYRLVRHIGDRVQRDLSRGPGR